MARNDGGPAFPTIEHTEQGDFSQVLYIGRDGMTLRDWFAGQALTHLVADPVLHSIATDKGMASTDAAAGLAYGFADAMLAAREEG